MSRSTLLATAGGTIVLATVVLVSTRRPAIRVFEDSITIAGEVRRFRVVVSETLHDQPRPLVLVFHGIGDSPEAMADQSGFDHLAGEHGFLLAYPEARRGMWWTTPDAATRPNPDLTFISALIDHLDTRFPVDARRIHLVGMSNGGSFAQRLAFAHPDRIASATSCAGPIPMDLAPPAERPFPVRLVVGADDPVRAAIERDAATYAAAGHAMEMHVEPNVGHRWPAGEAERSWTFLARHALPRP